MSTTNPTNETTEWDDLQRKFGNLPPLEKEIKEEEIYLQNIDKIENENVLEKKNLKELNLMEENCVDEEYLKIIEKYKNDRINQINRNRALDIYGDIYEISKDNFITEINEASKKNPLNEYLEKSVDDKDEEEIKRKHKNIKGTYVVIHLYSDNVVACKVLNEILKHVANKHKYIKFTKGVYNRIIENYPEFKLPTILIYYNGTCIHQICNLLNHIKGGLNNLNIKSFEQFLNKYKILKYKNYVDSDISDNDNDEDYKNKNRVKTEKQYASFNMFNTKYKNNDDEDDESSSEEKEMRSRGYASSYLDSKIRLNKF
ncbi:phosducin-like protein, putative [Plasmodium gallinaceum]|uniref:Phosducin-like protein, putative n=1 Tax=Plasmodium gallinaceum TaxID=5849 RepID=A0A1J1GZE9_PLAGA|nr:phosducin-like protein, putative [Plasmodium gallinaceum]CRG97942.1 phosducin-like protein, putative [Plasmodium gallinaceum]